MNVRRGGLGRGLGALIPSGPPPQEAPPSIVDDQAVSLAYQGGVQVGSERDPGSGSASDAEGGPESSPESRADRAAGAAPARVAAYFDEIPLDAIVPNPRQPRSVFDDEALAELAHSVREVGLLQPIVVRPLPGDRFELVMGERRWRAAREAGLTAIPAIVRVTGDQDLLRDALLENLHRSELNPLEEAAAYDQLLRDFGCTHDELAVRLGRSRPQISNTLRLLRLPAAVQRRVAAGVLSAGHARALLGLDSAEAQEKLAHRIVAEGLSVRATEEIVTLGNDLAEGKRARPRSRRLTAPGLSELAARLSDRYETRVRVDVGRTRGTVTIDFGSLDDLQRILQLMAPGERATEEPAGNSR